MKRLLVAGLLLLPSTVCAAEDCQVVEFADRFEVTCSGDAKPIPIPKQSIIPAVTQQQAAPVQSTAPEQQSAPQQADKTAVSPPTDTTKASAPQSAPYAKAPGRQGRPSSADMNAAIEARRKLIQESNPKAPPAAQ